MRRLCLAVLFLSALELALGARSFRRPPQPIDEALSLPLVSRLPCDGHTAAEDHLTVRAAFSAGGLEKSFRVSIYREDVCRYDLKVKCLSTDRAGWKHEWSLSSAEAGKTGAVSIRACYDWGSAQPAKYILSGMYRQAGNPKLVWSQAKLTQVSANPDVYEFTAPDGKPNRLEISRR